MSRFATYTARATIALSLLIAAQASAADVCVEVDTAADTLSENDRRGALSIARAAFGEAGQTVVDGPCDRRYTIAASTLGETVHATVRGPKGQRSGKVNSIDELGDLYQQLVFSLMKGKPASAGVTRANVTQTQNERTRLRAESLWFGSVGGAYLTDLDLDSVPLNLRGGYRHELDQFAVEGNASMTFASSTDGGGAFNTHFGVAGYYFLDPLADSSAYVGFGVGYGGSAEEGRGNSASGAGVHLVGSAGYEMLRASTIRAFIQTDLLVPLYAQRADDDESHNVYAPVLSLNVGIGWSPL